MNTNGDAPLKVVPVRHYGRWVASIAAVIAVAMVVHTLYSHIPTGARECVKFIGVDGKAHFRCHDVMGWRFEWNTVSQYFTNAMILKGLLLTLLLTVLSMTVGISLGVLAAVLRQSPSRALSGAAYAYTWFFRGTPVYVQLLFWFNIAAIYPSLHLGLPFGPHLLEIHTVKVLTPMVAAVIAFGLNEGAYMSEIVRGGILAVDEGQVEASHSLGLTRLQTLRLVVLPQAMRVIVPPTGNEVISMLKTTSLASAISVPELLRGAQNIYSANYQVIPLLIVASIWYLAITTILSVAQYYIERHFARGATRHLPLTPWQRIRRDFSGIAARFPRRAGVNS